MSTLVQAPSQNSLDPWAWRSARGAPVAPAQRGDNRAKWRLAAILAVALAACVYGAHAQSARLAPFARPILHSLGYPWRATTLRVETVSSRLVSDGHAPALLVEGALVNVEQQEIEAPPLRLAVRSADGAEIFVWSARTAKAHLGVGERTRFSSRLEAPPSAGVDVAVAIETKGAIEANGD